MEASRALGSGIACCENCDEPLRGPYCHACGAPDLETRDRSTRRYLGEAFGEITSLEHSKLLRTLHALLFRPGLLTTEFFTARRVRYLRPLTLCLSIFALSFLVYGAGNRVSMFDTARQASVEAAGGALFDLPKERLIQSRVEQHARQTGQPAAQIYERIDERWAANATLIQLPMIFLFGLVLKLAHRRSGRHLVEHLTFSMHFIAFQVLTVVLLWPFYRVLGLEISGPILLVVLFKYALDTTYLFVAIRRFYGGTVRGTLLRAPLTFGGYYVLYAFAQAFPMLAALRAVL